MKCLFICSQSCRIQWLHQFNEKMHTFFDMVQINANVAQSSRAKSVYSGVINRNATQSLVHYILYITHIIDNHNHCLTLAYFNVHLQFTLNCCSV